MSYEPEEPAVRRRSAAADSAKLPAIFLIIVGCLNILGSLYWAFSGFQARTAGVQAVQEQAQRDPMQQKNFQELEKQGFSIEKIVSGTATVFILWGLAGLLCSAVMILAGIKMMTLGSYGLCMTGSITAMLPCVIPCCILGLPVGIWSIVVLNRPDVKAAFR